MYIYIYMHQCSVYSLQDVKIHDIHVCSFCVSIRDDVVWGEGQKREAEEKVALNSQCPVPDDERGE